MTDVARQPIASNASIDAPYLWYDLAVDEDSGVLAVAGNYKGDTLPSASLDIMAATQAHRKAYESDSSAFTRSRRLALMTLLEDGSLVAIPEQDLAGEYLAHMGFYDPVTDVLTLLQFVDQDTGATSSAEVQAINQERLANSSNALVEPTL